MLAPEENGPCDAAGVLALEEEGFGFSILEAEDFAVATDVEFTLFEQHRNLVSRGFFCHFNVPFRISLVFSMSSIFLTTLALRPGWMTKITRLIDTMAAEECVTHPSRSSTPQEISLSL